MAIAGGKLLSLDGIWRLPAIFLSHSCCLMMPLVPVPCHNIVWLKTIDMSL